MNKYENATAAYYYKDRIKNVITGQGFWLKPVVQLLEIAQKHNYKKEDTIIHTITDPEILAVLIRIESRSPVGYIRDHLSDIESNFRNCMSSLEAVEEAVSSMDEIIQADKSCDWKLISTDDMGNVKFNTKCGASYFCSTDEPEESGFIYCPKCGRLIDPV